MRVAMDLFLGLLFGAIGTVYLIYGKRVHDSMYMAIGFLLIIYPYLFSNAIVVLVIGVLLTSIPIAHQRGVF